MTPPKPPKNLAASVSARLLTLARERREEPQFIQTRYAIERLLYRLSASPHAPSFVLKGAALFTLWSGHPHRPTKDVDLLSSGTPDLERLKQVFQSVCSTPVEDDGFVFDPTAVAAERIKEAARYQGVRVTLRATLGTARLGVQIDIGFGDAVTPAPLMADYPTLLGQPAPRLQVYPRETVVAEKFEAMVDLGLTNSRMKDFYDLWFLARSFSFKGDELASALKATFARRQTSLPTEAPLAMTPAFGNDAQKQTQWRAFLTRSRVAEAPLPLGDVVAQIWAFLDAPLKAAREGRGLATTWSEGSWR